MHTLKIITITIMILATFTNTHCALYTVINNGAAPVTVKIDTETKDIFGDTQISVTLTAQGLNPRESTQLDAKGGHNAYRIYLLPSVPGKNLKLKPLPLTNGNSKERDALWVKFDEGSDYTIKLTSKPNPSPNNPKALLWTITPSKN